MATIYHLILLSIFLLSPFSKAEGERLCIDNVRVFQKSSGFGAGHVPEYTVTISNIGQEPVSGVHVSCGEFSSASLINPEIFQRLNLGDCLVKDGEVIDMAEVVSFTYTNFPPYELIVSAAHCLDNN
ncbi:TPD1 protein homolog 1A-like [Dioscorea cayenensis subsp. rotundata]|uniref:TPD1 protein homolog 1A-like n=1 Tax=Dioscorea cayennensis subsp. rotundata TaxID=55577 RepID=A0AB40CKY9_DIOCR|nr:TPD1 protein homolog 1A-like [Dioscorea cayenensis subsp. rotundata]